MAKVRQDAWSHDDDLLLAETVLRHVREGSTQLNAFEEVGDKLNRTSAACGFRWNAEVRKRYKSAMELAKRQRKERQRALARQKNQAKRQTVANRKSIKGELTLNQVIDFLSNLKDDFSNNQHSALALEQAEEENKKLKEQVEDLKSQLEKTKGQLETIQEDYQTFIQIMDRARKMTVFEDDDDFKAPSFRMDKNGNLEQLAKRMN